MLTEIPVLDVSSLRSGGDSTAIGQQLDAACRDTGFFCIVGHGISPRLTVQLDNAAREFFDLPEASKSAIAMPVGGRAWRGWFPLGGEMTNEIPDRKEGVYFGRELAVDHPRVLAATPLHGANLFPAEVPELRVAVLAWLDAMTELGHIVMSGISVGLGLPDDWLRNHFTADPTVLFRIFRYPPSDAPTSVDAGEWGVAEHTDYGLLTLLLQDDCAGLQVKGRTGWVDVPPVPGSFVCNIGDMLERMTGGRYRSTPHRVRNTGRRDRLSFPFFFDPSWDASVDPLPLAGGTSPDQATIERWDGRSVFDFEGTYGSYLTAKVSKVFPDLVRVI